MSNEKKAELSKEELENAAGGFTASQKRPKTEPLSQAELERASGGVQHQTRNKTDGVNDVKGAPGDNYGQPPQGNMHGRTTST